MLTLAILGTLVVGWLLGGRLTRFEKAGIRLILLPVVAMALQLLLQLLKGETYYRWAGLILLDSYALLFTFLLLNRHLQKSTLLLFLGSVCNLLVIMANGFRMPVSAQAGTRLSAAGFASLAAGEIPMYTLAGDKTRLLFLGDMLYIPVPGFRGFASIGDCLLAAGFMFLLMAVMAPKRGPRWLKTG
ncbi:MAG: DUF5317 domain-containing protein [Intestinimonas sp.]|jgi:hypothetical protein|nr:DUF5317 domain-containing protein [Intestinimonas sp.]